MVKYILLYEPVGYLEQQSCEGPPLPIGIRTPLSCPLFPTLAFKYHIVAHIPHQWLFNLLEDEDL